MNFSAKSVNLILVSEILSFWTHLLEVFLENLLEFFSKCPKKPGSSFYYVIMSLGDTYILISDAIILKYEVLFV